ATIRRFGACNRGRHRRRSRWHFLATGCPMDSTSTVTRTTRPRRWWLAGIFGLAFFLVVAVLVLTCAYFVHRHRTYAAWAEAAAETDQLDPGWRLADIEADRERVPDAENSALRIIAITAQARDFRIDKAPNYAQVFPEPPPTVGLNEAQRQLIRG